MLCLTLSSVLGGGCASRPTVTSFDGKWTLIEVPGDPKLKACLEEEDVQKLRETLIRCESGAPK
jgi:hypothetical protein